MLFPRYEWFNNLKKINPNLKTLLAVSGWNLASTPFTKMVRERVRERGERVREVVRERCLGFTVWKSNNAWILLSRSSAMSV